MFKEKYFEIFFLSILCFKRDNLLLLMFQKLDTQNRKMNPIDLTFLWWELQKKIKDNTFTITLVLEK